MRATDLFARRVDHLHTDERFEELARILAGGLLRLKASRVPPPESSDSRPQKNPNSEQKPLELSSGKRRHVHAG